MRLEADVLIRRLSAGKKSLDDVARAFFGHGSDTGPQVLPYTRDDVVTALNAVQPYDWRTLFAQRVDAVAPYPPDNLTGGGYKLVFTATPSAYEKLQNARRASIDLRYSLGIVAGSDGTVTDVFPDGVAYRAGSGRVRGSSRRTAARRPVTGATRYGAAGCTGPPDSSVAHRATSTAASR